MSIRERKESALEEERRLFYVATTRAEKYLFLTESEGYNFTSGTEKYPSRFISEITDSLIDIEGTLRPELLEGAKNLINRIDTEITTVPITIITKGDRVSHKLFGIGVVIQFNQEEDSYKVQFEDGVRNIRPSFLEPFPLPNHE